MPMKKILLFLSFLVSSLLYSQVTTNPSIPSIEGEITIIFNATDTPLEGETGDIYAHTGATVDGERWQYVIGEWAQNSVNPKLTRDNSNPNRYTFTITPDIHSFYGIPAEGVVTELSFVFRNSNASTQTSPDIFIDIFQGGLNVAFTSPNDGAAYDRFEVITFEAEASSNADLELFVDGESKKSVSNNTQISYTTSFSDSGNHTIKVTAEAGTETKESEISIFIKAPTSNQPMPAGVENGVNSNPDNSVTFVLLAPGKESVHLLGDFNDWSISTNYQMYKDGDHFWVTVPDLDPNTEYAYQYFIDYSIKVADPYSEKILDPWNDQWIKEGNYPDLKEYPTGKTEGFVSAFKINEAAYAWEVQDFIKPDESNLIIYELHIRDFVESDSYNEALTRLDYLEGLGVNAIELMPVNEFEGADSWGYNPALYFALDKAYGTKNKFKEFVDECHKRGIAVIVDVVFNHSFSQSPMVQMYWNSAANKPASDNPWYNEDHNFVDNTSAHWGYDFNHESQYTVDFFNDVISYWIEEYKVDGYRFDFTKGFSNTLWYGSNNWASDYDASRIDILKNYADHTWSHDIDNKPYVIFEHLSENSEEKELADYGILLWGNLHWSFSQNTKGKPGGGNIDWMSYQRRGWTKPGVVGYMESHDEQRIMFENLNDGESNTNYNVKDLNTALEREELAGMFLFTIPGPKMIWQFGEVGYDYDINFNDRVGRKPVRWDYFDVPNRKHVYNTWATMIQFKTAYPDVFNTETFNLIENGLIKTLSLSDDSMDVVIIGNFDIVSKEVNPNFTKTGTWYNYFNSEELEVSNTTETITLKPGEYRMYSTVKLADPRGGTNSDDSDNDGISDDIDNCPNSFPGAVVNEFGCELFSLPADNFTVQVTSETCPDKNNGIITITAKSAEDYSVTINGTDYDFTSELVVENLPPNVYEFCISVKGTGYSQCYEVTVDAGVSLLGKTTLAGNKLQISIESGTAPFYASVNGIVKFESNKSEFEIDVHDGDEVEISTKVSCEGVLAKKIDFSEMIGVYPNPSKNVFTFSIPQSQGNVAIEIFSISGSLISTGTYSPSNGKVAISLENKTSGLYIAKVYLKQPLVFKIIKE